MASPKAPQKKDGVGGKVVEASKFSAYDEYGFERPPDFDHSAYETFMSGYLPVLVRRGQRWEQLVGAGTTGTQAAAYANIAKGRKIKRFVRKGIPSSHRAKVWMILSGADELRKSNPSEYLQMLSVKVDPRSATVEQIITDLNRTFPTNIYFKKEDPKCLQQPLFNVLLAYSNANPRVGYCQGMNYIAGLLLLVTKDEEMSFFLLRALTEKLLPEYYGPSIPGLITDVRVFSELLRLKSPVVFRHVESFRMPWALICSKWFVCLYSDVLPVETVLRIWDCLFNEGSKILFRVAVTLVMMNEDKILATKEFTEMVSQFQKCTINDRTTQCHEFVSTMFDMSSPLSSVTIARLRSEIGFFVREEEMAREKRKVERERKAE